MLYYTILEYAYDIMTTPSSHSKNSQSKICSKGWVAQKPFFDRQFDGGAKII